MTINGRKSHIKRCMGVSKNDSGGTDPNPNLWYDILRTDEFKYTTSDGQGYRFILKWSDDVLKEDADDYDNAAGIKGRKTELGKGTDPELPFDPDPSDYIPFRVINQLTIQDSGQGVKYIFKNKNATTEGVPISTTRDIWNIRLKHKDTIVDDQLNDDTGSHIVQDDQYAFMDGTEDKSQYADMEVIKNWKHDLRSDAQVYKVVLQNKDILASLGINVEESLSPGTNSSGVPTIAARMDPFQTIVNAQFRRLYLLVSVSASNGSFSFGPYPPAPSVTAPLVGAIKNDTKPSVRLLDTVKPAAANNSGSGFQVCFPYLIGGDLVASWIVAHGGGGRIPPVSGSCPVINPHDPSATTGPINYQAFAGVATLYLYSIPADNDLATLNISGIVPPFDSGLNTSTYSQTTKSGSGSIDIRIYSRVHGEVKTINDLLDLGGDGKPRPTEDDRYFVDITNGNQGKFTVNVHLDKDPADVQTDNYGKSFQPYKVTTTPDIGMDFIPSQPPLLLSP